MQTKEVMQPNIIEACAIPSSVETDSSSSNYMFLGTIIQRIMSNNGTAESGFGISEEEKALLLAELDKFKEGGN